MRTLSIDCRGYGNGDNNSFCRYQPERSLLTGKEMVRWTRQAGNGGTEMIDLHTRCLDFDWVCVRRSERRWALLPLQDELRIKRKIVIGNWRSWVIYLVVGERRVKKGRNKGFLRRVKGLQLCEFDAEEVVSRVEDSHLHFRWNWSN